MIKEVFRFPDPVNETAARTVAAGVVAQAALLLVLREWWVLVPLTYGFGARVATGPRLSPLGQFATRVVAPAFEARQVPGPPKRFAQAIGLTVTASASLAWLLGAPAVAFVLVGVLLLAAALEAVFAICIGCIVYGAIWGCADCDDITERLRRALAIR